MFALSESVTVALVVTLGPLLLGIITLQFQARKKVEQVHLLVNDRLDKVLAANEGLVAANRDLVNTIADLNAHIQRDATSALSASDQRAVGRAIEAEPLATSLRTTPLAKPDDETPEETK